VKALNTGAGDPFVGRGAELGVLRERLDAATGGAGSVVFVCGERGIGKTALVGEFLRRVRSGSDPVTIVAGRCVEQQGPREAFLPFLDAGGRLLLSAARERALELLRTYAPTVGLQFPPGLVPDPDGELQRRALGATKERLIRETGDFMEAASRDFPIVILIEDLQWADEASVEMLDHVARRCPRQRLLLLGTLREEDVDASEAPLRRIAPGLLSAGLARRLVVPPLDPQDVVAWIEARFPSHQLPEALPAALHSRAEGHPLFVRGLVELLVERGDIALRDGAWCLVRAVEALDLSPARELGDLVRRRLDVLPTRERDLLRHASVAGLEFLSPIVTSLVGGDEIEVEETLDRLYRVHRLLDSRGEEELPDGTLAVRYRFSHGLYRSVLYDELVVRRRASLHRRVAERLRHHLGRDAERRAVEIAEHYERGRDIASAAAFRQHAGDAAVERYAFEEAEQQYDWALRLLERLPADARAQPIRALYEKRGEVRYTMAAFDAAVNDFTRALEAARSSGSAPAECGALNRLCDALLLARRVDEMAVRAHEGLEIAARTGGSRRLTEARARLGQVLVCEGRLSEATPLLEAVIDAARRSGPRSALMLALGMQGLAHYWHSEYGLAETCFDEMLAVAGELGRGFEGLTAWMFLGLSRANLGRASDALTDFQAAMALASQNGDRLWMPRLLGHAAWVRSELGDLEAARALDTEAAELSRRQHLVGAPGVEALLRLAIERARTGSRTEALGLIREAEVHAGEDAWFHWMHELQIEAAAAEVFLALGDHEEADARALRLRAVSDRIGAPAYRCTAGRVRGEVALALDRGVAQAAEDVEAALQSMAEKTAPLATWKAGRILGLLRRRLGDDDRARRAFEGASGSLEKMAGGVRDPMLRRTFLELPAVRELLHTPAGGDR
jgi:tetratricopeptide (TPR) repeat protein